MHEETPGLVVLCLQGDQTAMKELVQLYCGKVFGLCYRMLGQREDAEDVAQETFVRVLKNLQRWDPRRDFEPWLLAIAGNRCRSMLASRCRRPRREALPDMLTDNSPDLQAARNLAEEVELALTTIRADYRQAFLLFHEQQLSYAEIAEVMDCPLGTAKTWVHRARRELIQRLTKRGVVQELRHAM